MNGTNSSIIQDVGDFQFAPLVNNKLHMTADLNITMLRPGRPGSLITHAGDIDNRLKTLLDALKVPEPGALPKDARPTSARRAPCGCASP